MENKNTDSSSNESPELAGVSGKVGKTAKFSPTLEALKQRFIVPVEVVVDLMRPIQRPFGLQWYYCPYAPCCSQCNGIFVFAEMLGHLRRVHHKTSAQIKVLVKKFPSVPTRDY